MPFNLINHPTVGISWYEAVALCQWLTEVWRAEGTIADDEVVRLPTEAEWEKAARGTGGRIYPWGNEFDMNRANMDETGISTSSAIGCFSGGASPYGCLDMAGNVWEWTISLWGQNQEEAEFKYPYQADNGRESPEASEDVLRVLRGGAFDVSRDEARCSARHRELPSTRVDNCGFRMCVVSQQD